MPTSPKYLVAWRLNDSNVIREYWEVYETREALLVFVDALRRDPDITKIYICEDPSDQTN
jgi:hypothetical protein